MLEKVHELAANSLPKNLKEPGISDLLRSLDLVLGSDKIKEELHFIPSQEVSNTVYRQIIKSEKKKAYDSVVSLQSEIYNLQDQNLGLDGKDETYFRSKISLMSEYADKQDITFAQSVQQTSTLQDNMASIKTSNWLIKGESLKQLHQVDGFNEEPIDLQEITDRKGTKMSSQNDFQILAVKFDQKIAQTQQSLSSSQRFNAIRKIDQKDNKYIGHFPELNIAKMNIKNKKPPLQISVTKTSNTCVSQQTTPMNPESQNSGHIRSFLYNTSREQISSETSQDQTKNTKLANGRGSIEIEQPMMLLSNYQQTPTVHTTISSHQFNRQNLVSQLNDYINHEDKEINDSISTFEILEQVIQLKQNHSFVRRCQKLKKMKSESNKKDQQQVTFSDSFVAGEQKEWLNSDLQSVFGQQRHRSLPKLILSKENSEESTSSSESLSSQKKKRSRSIQPNRAVDSNKAIAVVYYVRNLLIKGLKSLSQQKQEQEAKRFLKQATEEKQNTKVMKKTFKSLKTYFKMHEGHRQSKQNAQLFFKVVIGRLYLKNWNNVTKLKLEEDYKLKEGQLHLKNFKKLRLFKNWRATILEDKLLRVQYKTARRVVIQRTLTKSFHALHAFARYQTKERFLRTKGKMGNRKRLHFKAFKSWQKFHIKQSQKFQMNALAHQLNENALKRLAILKLREFLEECQHQRDLIDCAKLFHQLQLKKQFIVFLKKNESFNQYRRHRKMQMKKFYEDSLKRKLIRSLHATNIEFIERSVLVQDFMLRRKKRVFFYLLRAFVRYNQVNLTSQNPSQFYMVWLWLQKYASDKKVMCFSQLKYEKRLSKKYVRQQSQATKMLKTFYLQSIFSIWKKECNKVLALKQKFKKNLLMKITDKWAERASQNGKIRRKYRSHKKVKNAKTMLRVFRAIKQFLSKTKMIKQIAKKVRKSALKRNKARFFKLWLGLHMQITTDINKKQLSQKAERYFVFRKFMKKWQKKYQHCLKKKELAKKLKKFQNKNFKFKFLQQWKQKINKHFLLEQKDLSLLIAQKTKLIKNAFKALKANRSIQKHKKDLFKMLANKRIAALMSSVIKAWKSRIPEIKQKKLLLLAVSMDQKQKIIQRVFDALKSRKDYTIERTTTDAIMTNAIQTLTLRRFFKKWEGLFSKRLGLQLLTDSFDKMQQRLFFQQNQAILVQNNKIFQHLSLYREFKHLQHSMESLQKNARRKDHLQAKIQDCCSMRKKVLVQFTIRAWHNYASKIKKNLKMYNFFAIAISRVIAYKYFKVLKQRRSERLKIKQVRRNTLDGLLRSVFYKFRNIIYMRKLNAFVQAQYKRKTAISMLKLWNRMALQKIQANKNHLKKGQKNRKLQILVCWRRASIRQHQLKTILARALQNNFKRILQCFFKGFRQQCSSLKLLRLRQNSIFAYEIQKQQLKAFAALLHATQISRQNKQKNLTAAIFFRETQLRKILFELKVFAAGSKCHRQCITFISSKRLLPKSLNSLKGYAQLMKIKINLKTHAKQQLQRKLKAKAVKALKHNQNIQKQKKFALHQLHKGFLNRLLIKTFQAWTRVQFNLQEKRAKRYCLKKIIMGVDQQLLLKSTFEALFIATTTQKSRFEQLSMIVKKNRKRNLFQCWNSVILKQKELRKNQNQTKQAKLKLMQMRFFKIWKSRYQNYQQAKLMAARKVSKVLIKAFKSLKLAVQRKKANQCALLWHQEFQKKAFFNAVQNQIQRKQYRNDCVMELQIQLCQKLKQKVLLSLKYFVLSQKGAKLIQAKLDQKLIMKALDALKYSTISFRVIKKFRQLKESHLKHKMLKLWVSRLVSIKKQQFLLKPIILMLHKQNLAQAFISWKKEVFRVKLLHKLQEHLVLPKEAENAIRCFYSWQKFSSFKKNSFLLANEVKSIKDDNLKRKLFSVWLQAAIQQAPIRIFCTKMERLEIIINARQAFQNLVCNYQRQLIHENAADQVLDEKRLRDVMNIWSVWKKRVMFIRFGQEISNMHNGNQLTKYLQKWKFEFRIRCQQKRQIELEKQAMGQAFNYYCHQQVKKSFTKIVFYLLRRRQKRQADQFRRGQLLFSAFQSFSTYSQEQEQRSSLNRKLKSFQTAKQSQFQAYFFALWFKRYRGETIVKNFKNQKEREMKRIFFGQLVCELNIQKKLDKIGSHATIYFERRRQIQVISDCFNAIKECALQRQVRQKIKILTYFRKLDNENQSILQAKAQEFRLNRLLESTFKKWKNKIKIPEKNRSTLYTCFSGWKFQTKERVLLKKYLFECGESIGDMSLMTTLEMRDSVGRMMNNQQNSNEKGPQSSMSLSMEKSLVFNSGFYAITQQTIDPSQKQNQLDEEKFNLQLHKDRSKSSLADRRLQRIQQNSSLIQHTIEDEKSFDVKQLPMILHKSQGFYSQN